MVKEIEWSEIEYEYPTEYDEEREDYFVLLDDAYYVHKETKVWKRAKYLFKDYLRRDQNVKYDMNSLEYLNSLQDVINNRSFMLHYNYKYAEVYESISLSNKDWNNYSNWDEYERERKDWDDTYIERLVILNWKIARQIIRIKYHNGIENCMDDDIKGFLAAKNVFLNLKIMDGKQRNPQDDIDYIGKCFKYTEEGEYWAYYSINCQEKGEWTRSIHNALGTIWEYHRLGIFPKNKIQYLLFLDWMRDTGYIETVTKDEIDAANVMQKLCNVYCEPKSTRN